MQGTFPSVRIYRRNIFGALSNSLQSISIRVAITACSGVPLFFSCRKRFNIPSMVTKNGAGVLVFPIKIQNHLGPYTPSLSHPTFTPPFSGSSAHQKSKIQYNPSRRFHLVTSRMGAPYLLIIFAPHALSFVARHRWRLALAGTDREISKREEPSFRKKFMPLLLMI